MTFHNVSGQSHVKQTLLSALREESFSHAYVFHGPAGTGKRKMAQALAKALLCSSGEEDACGSCQDCKTFESGNHAGLLEIFPDGATVKIGQTLRLKQRFSYRTSDQEKSVYIIHEAEKMTAQAANSLLKFLEEPTLDVVAILITDNKYALLPTILSRTQQLAFFPESPAKMEKELIAEGFPDPLVKAAVRLQNNTDSARELIQWEQFAEIRNLMLQLEKERSKGYAAASVAIQQRLVKADLMQHLHLFLDLWVLWFKDLLRVQQGRIDQLVFVDQLNVLKTQALRSVPAKWVEGIDHARKLRSRLSYHVNPQLALEHFLFQLQED